MLLVQQLVRSKCLGSRSQIESLQASVCQAQTSAEGRFRLFVFSRLLVRAVLRSMMLVRILVIVVAICSWGRSQAFFESLTMTQALYGLVCPKRLHSKATGARASSGLLGVQPLVQQVARETKLELAMLLS